MPTHVADTNTHIKPAVIRLCSTNFEQMLQEKNISFNIWEREVTNECKSANTRGKKYHPPVENYGNFFVVSVKTWTEKPTKNNFETLNIDL